MNPDWQSGGRNWLDIAYAYGTDAADALAALDAADDTRAFQQLLSDLRRGNTTRQWGSDSTVGNFGRQIVTDPLAAPLESANRQIGLAVWNVFKNPFVLVLVVVVVFHLLGGFDWLGKKLRTA